MKPKTAHLIKKIKDLPTEKISAVEDFVDFLHHKTQTERSSRSFSRLAEKSFGNVWGNPEDAIYDKL